MSESEYALQRLRNYASVFHKAWIEIDFKDGKFVSLRKVDMEKNYNNTIALKNITLSKDFYLPKWNDCAYVPLQNWWFNGHILCNTDQKWTDRGLDILYYMFSKTNLGQLTKTIILNKRDYAWVRKNQTYPYPWRFDDILPIEFYKVPMQKPLSFYGGENWDDILIPIPEHWNVWGETELCRDIKLKNKIPHIVFRGTLTGPNINIQNDRIKANIDFKNIAWADVKLTDWTSRERLQIENNILNIIFPTFTRSDISFGPKLTFLQQSNYELLLYIDGHVASSRKAWHLCSGSIVLCLKSKSYCPKQWFDDEWDTTAAIYNLEKKQFDINNNTTTHFQCDIDTVVEAASFILNLDQNIKLEIIQRCLQKASHTFSKENMAKIVKDAILKC
jgi:hypothetical protein